jgi:hypothetical protein
MSIFQGSPYLHTISKKHALATKNVHPANGPRFARFAEIKRGPWEIVTTKSIGNGLQVLIPLTHPMPLLFRMGAIWG